jgi:transcriptional regulator with XRE-family HTH domain
MTIRERVKKLCSENNISMNKLECECGFAKGYLSKLDKSSPNSAKLQLIADFFGVTLDYIMTGVEKQVSITEQSELLSDMLPPLKSQILKWGLLAQWLY